MQIQNTVMTADVGLCVLSGWNVKSLAQEILPDGSQPAKLAISAFRIPDGMEMDVFAAEPQVASQVVICVDEKGRVYAAEEYRFNRGTPENRTQDFFLEDDLQMDSLEDRLALYKKVEDRSEGGMNWFTKFSDQVRILKNRDGYGRADFSKIFAGEFNGLLDGLAAGLIARDGLRLPDKHPASVATARHRRRSRRSQVSALRLRSELQIHRSRSAWSRLGA